MIVWVTTAALNLSLNIFSQQLVWADVLFQTLVDKVLFSNLI